MSELKNELKCNHCGVEFPLGFEHECSYEKLKEVNARLCQALQFYAEEHTSELQSHQLSRMPSSA